MANLKSFWIINVSNMNVSLADLNLTVKPHATVNLLDSKHYHLTEDQVLKSALSGSLFVKRNKIYLRDKGIRAQKPEILCEYDTTKPTKKHTAVEIEYQEFEELNISDEEFAKENAEFVDEDFNNKGKL